jgi:uncharacterized membrane protein YdjX (TVP38/TMEM64 family)
MSSAVAETLAKSEFHLTRRTILVGLGVLVAVVVAVVLLQDAGGGDGLGLITEHASSSYLGVALLVFLDAVCPVFPGETTLNAASTLAAQGKFNLGLVILGGAVGAIAGDSALYWTARLFSKRFDQRIDHVKQNKKVAEALAFLGGSAPLLLTAGRFVLGVRFVVNATLGIEKYSYPRFSSGRRSAARCGVPTPASSPTPSEPRWPTSRSRRWSSPGRSPRSCSPSSSGR